MEMAMAVVMEKLHNFQDLAKSGKLPAMQEFARIEKMLASFARLKKLAPKMMKFVDDVLNVTDKQMKATILSKLKVGESLVQSDQKTIMGCSDDLDGQLKPGLDELTKLPTLRKDWEQCVFKHLTAISLEQKATKVEEVNWNFVNRQLALMQDNGADTSLVTPFITGNWAGEKKESNCNEAVGTSAALTANTCQVRDDHCRDFADANSMKQLDMCSKVHPKFTHEQLPQSCRNGTCCDDPDTSECDYKEGHYKTKGDYYLAMAKYWKSMVTLWHKSRDDCDQWTRWCCGNQSLCAMDPVPHACVAASLAERPSPSPNRAVSLLAKSLNVSSNGLGDCIKEQDTLDRLSCEGSRTLVGGCSNYKDCYSAANKTYNLSWSTVCGPNGQVHILKHEYYSLMRIECLLKALGNKELSPSEGVRQCSEKTIRDYDLGMFDLKVCNTGWPDDLSMTNQYCLKYSRGFAAWEDCSGSRAYEEKYYTNIPSPKACTSSCCTIPLDPFKPLDGIVA
eukprot:TRINITY_DN16725_c1_g1_i2.p1 TRINITY_DN16725_c1_g1~~TRINITY_DN16725_c1_g1_i2.p1  ORF type:complete len:507 (+),score=83.47 TRINITY_DN16725_c1_g1_i2:150-1670(+)